MTTWGAIRDALRPIALTTDGAAEIASAFYDVYWVPADSACRTYAEAFDEAAGFVLTWRNAGALAAELSGVGSYIDWAWEAESGIVSGRVRDTMAALGLRPVF